MQQKWNMKKKLIYQGEENWRYKRKKTLQASIFALDFKRSVSLIEGFVKLYHLCQISDTPWHADCN